MNKDFLCEMRKHLRKYHDAEQCLITTNPTLAETDEENYQDSYKWLRLPIVDESPETVSDMILSKVEEFPNDCLSGILVEVLKNGVPKDIFQGIGVDRVGNSFRFCISGSVSLEELQSLCELWRLHHGWEDEA